MSAHSSTPRPASIPTGVAAGAQACTALLSTIGRTLREQVQTRGDYDPPALSCLVYRALPRPGSEEAIGFAIALGEYLASVADGWVPGADFQPSELARWQEVCHG